MTILNDGSISNETRLGAVADIQFALNSVDKKDDNAVLVIAGDTLFFHDFKLEEFIRYLYFKFEGPEIAHSLYLSNFQNTF